VLITIKSRPDEQPSSAALAELMRRRTTRADRSTGLHRSARTQDGVAAAGMALGLTDPTAARSAHPGASHSSEPPRWAPPSRRIRGIRLSCRSVSASQSIDRLRLACRTRHGMTGAIRIPFFQGKNAIGSMAQLWMLGGLFSLTRRPRGRPALCSVSHPHRCAQVTEGPPGPVQHNPKTRRRQVKIKGAGSMGGG
jgi:hypothetical protein